MQTRSMATKTVYSTKIEDLPDICTAKHLAAALPPAESTWRYWAHIGEGGPPSFKLGKHRVWRKEAVLAWLAEQEAGS